MGCMSSSCRALKQFPVWVVTPLLQHWGGIKKEQSFLQLQMNPQSNTNPSHICFITSPAQAAWNWDTSGPPFHSAQAHNDQLYQLWEEGGDFDKFWESRTAAPTGSMSCCLMPTTVHQSLAISHHTDSEIWRGNTYTDFTWHQPWTCKVLLAQAQHYTSFGPEVTLEAVQLCPHGTVPDPTSPAGPARLGTEPAQTSVSMAQLIHNSDNPPIDNEERKTNNSHFGSEVWLIPGQVYEHSIVPLFMHPKVNCFRKISEQFWG